MASRRHELPDSVLSFRERLAAALAGWLLMASVLPLHGQQPMETSKSEDSPMSSSATGPMVAMVETVSIVPRSLPPDDHPWHPTLRWAHEAEKTLCSIHDYSCLFVKRELIGEELGEHQYMSIKVRHKPFSVYVSFLGPAQVKGQEAIYVEGRNDGNLIAHTTGVKALLVGTLAIKPDSALAMQGNRHPITNLGMLNLTRQVIQLAEHSIRHNDGLAQFFPGAKVNGRECTCVQIVHDKPRQDLGHHLRRIFVDKETSLPIRYEAYDWPGEPGEPLQLCEEYTYLNLKVNNGFDDIDFDPKNPSYRYK